MKKIIKGKDGIIIGNTENGKLEGKGKIIYNNGNVYNVTFKNNKIFSKEPKIELSEEGKQLNKIGEIAELDTPIITPKMEYMIDKLIKYGEKKKPEESKASTITNSRKRKKGQK